MQSLIPLSRDFPIYNEYVSLGDCVYVGTNVSLYMYVYLGKILLLANNYAAAGAVHLHCMCKLNKYEKLEENYRGQHYRH